MIVRIMVVDPEPRNAIDDVIIYQVPERSRQEVLLCELLDNADIDWVKIKSTRRKKKGKDND